MMTHSQPPGRLAWLKSPAGLMASAALGLFVTYLLLEHTVHVMSVLPFGLILLCPLMHLFMHGGRAGGEHSLSEQHEDAKR